jgi:DNA (cytosine-5)-methyltransferase 1
MSSRLAPVKITPMLKSLSVFSGCGGLDSGVFQAGFAPLALAEIDPHAINTLRYWLGQHGLDAPIFSDVTQLNPHSLLEQLGLRAGELDLLFGGSPCQSYSLIGKRKSLDDERGELLFEIPRLAKVLQPKVILMEQVKGLLSAPGYDGERGGAFKVLLEKLEELGYTVRFQILNAAHFGVPQLRERLFIVAARDAFVFPAATHSAKPEGSLFALPVFKTVWDAIADLPAPTLKGEAERVANHVDITPARDRERIFDVPEGDYLARQLHLPASVRCNLNPKKDTTKFRRLSRFLPSLTLRGGEPPYHPLEPRYITPRESLRLHGFTDDHVLIAPIRGRSGTFNGLDQHRLVANAVPPPLARVLAEAIKAQFLTTAPRAEALFAASPLAVPSVMALFSAAESL